MVTLLRPWQEEPSSNQPPVAESTAAEGVTELAAPPTADIEPPAPPTSDTEPATSTTDTDASDPPLSPPQPATVRRRIALTSRVLPAAPPYRCVSPFARDHGGRMALVLRYANGHEISFISSGYGDTGPFFFCGGSITHGRPGLASGTVSFEARTDVLRLVRVSGILGSDFETGSGRHVELDVLYQGQTVCSFSTDEAGHARRFACGTFPKRSDLSGLTLHLLVSGDREYGAFAGIARLEAIVAVEEA